MSIPQDLTQQHLQAEGSSEKDLQGVESSSDQDVETIADLPHDPAARQLSDSPRSEEVSDKEVGQLLNNLQKIEQTRVSIEKAGKGCRYYQ